MILNANFEIFVEILEIQGKYHKDEKMIWIFRRWNNSFYGLKIIGIVYVLCSIIELLGF